MNKAFSFILGLIILLSTMGFTSSTHYCGGKKIKSKITIGKADVSCGMETDTKTPCSEEETIKSDCCKDIYQHFEIEDDYTQQQVKINIHQPFIVAILATWLNIFNTETTQADYYSDRSPPPLIKDFSILLQVFRL